MSPPKPATISAKPLPAGASPRPVFCYGSLMAAEVYARVGHRRHALVGFPYPALRPSQPADEVLGVLVHVQTHEEIRILDRFESDDYDRTTVMVTTRGETAQEVEADVYMWQGDMDILSNTDWDFAGFVEREMKGWLGGGEVREVTERADAGLGARKLQ
ncbi:hypothetical protein BDK51DRAFT_44065 [Blyttiomyces helicus]|uniref:Putative gamma-glutamylcyclotransferase n=1 Tax=Blyttiomyces helicus TaxID=388810 RepID=A0A4V1ISC5_9FUNG|nr:hypothetical protein BDK51DRAFT_44065 [Blyttiomyces helicus]|eukprot:RKO93077.1 hypothetical protein BDK51DRAFT_44065 [Blyttiomyces helicus]